jgi:hypothetical protein
MLAPTADTVLKPDCMSRTSFSRGFCKFFSNTLMQAFRFPAKNRACAVRMRNYSEWKASSYFSISCTHL